MATNLTIIGNATGDAEMKFLPSGVGLCAFTVAVTDRVKKGETYVDGETTFYRCTAWRQMAECCAETITRGMRLVVHGRLTTRSYETTAGEKRLSVELDVEAVGPDLRYATATVAKVQRGSSAGPAHGRSGSGGGGDPWGDVPPPDSEMAPF